VRTGRDSRHGRREVRPTGRGWAKECETHAEGNVEKRGQGCRQWLGETRNRGRPMRDASRPNWLASKKESGPDPRLGEARQ
jgi:hypothetical protein